MERLTFNVGSSRSGSLVIGGRATQPRPDARARVTAVKQKIAAVRERYDWDYLWMLAFTTLLFFRPQDHIRALESLHLAELTAIGGLAAMAIRRLRSGLTIAKVNPEVVGVMALGGIIVLTIPFSIWPGGSLKVFSDIYVKIILIFALMMSTITSPRRLRQMTWIMIVASGYIAGRGVYDYLRGVNLVEGDRLRGAVGGMFENPNDLALNLVTFLAPALFIIIQERKSSRRLFACLLAGLMFAAAVFTKSRSGFLGLIAMGAAVMFYTARVKPGLLVAVLLGSILAMPVMPESFWNRMDSIFNAETDPTGSRAARLRLIDQGLEVFAENPVTGIGVGQFQNYNAPGVVEKWRVTHNVWLQVAAELGMFGFLTFLFLVVRAYMSCFATLRMLKPKRRRGKAREQTPAPELFTDEERGMLVMNAQGMFAALVGWTVCSFFASVAFNWTFYYVLALAVAGREIVASRRAALSAVEPEPTPEPGRTTPTRLIRAHA
jgi:putative inorganic carbon (hco3(-)) transporter